MVKVAVQSILVRGSLSSSVFAAPPCLLVLAGLSLAIVNGGEPNRSTSKTAQGGGGLGGRLRMTTQQTKHKD